MGSYAQIFRSYAQSYAQASYWRFFILKSIINQIIVRKLTKANENKHIDSKRFFKN